MTKTCSHAGCNYPEGECSGFCGPYDPTVHAVSLGMLSASCLAPSQLAALRARGTHGLPIDLAEPCPARVEGDRVPCHLFMPDVAWLAPLGPVLRPLPRRDTWLQRPVRPWSPIEAGADLPEPPCFGCVVSAFVTLWVSAGVAALVARALGVL